MGNINSKYIVYACCFFIGCRVLATRTLGVKFEVVGFKGAVNSLKELKRGINESIKANKNAVRQNIEVAKSEELRAVEINKANNRIKLSFLDLRLFAKKQTSGIVADTKRSLNKIQTDLDDWYKFNYGSTSQKQTVIIKEELADFKGRQTYKNLDKNSKSQVLENRLILREFLIDLRKLVNEDLREVIEESVSESNSSSIVDRTFSAVKSPIKGLLDAALFPFQSIIAGAFERFGEVQVQDIAEGFNRKFQKSLGLPLETVGEDLGDIFGSSLYRTYESILKRGREAILSDVDDKSPQLKAFAEDFKNTLLAASLKALAMPIRAHKRIQMRKKAVPLAKQQAGEMLINKEVSDDERKSINESSSITLLTGGVTMDGKGDNTDFVQRLMDNGYLEGTHVVPIKNPWSNSKLGAEYRETARKIVKNILSTPQISDKVIEQLKSEDNAKILKELDTEGDLELNDKFLDSVLDFFEKKDLPFIKVLETAYEGYNPDDAAIAATAMFYKQNFPDKPISLVGNSAGGFNVAGAMEMLNVMGYEDIQATGISTPITGLEFTGDEDNYVVHLGTDDFLYQGLYEGPLKDILLPPDYMNILEGGGKGHMVPLYLADPNFQGRFAEQQKGRIGVAKDMGSEELNYFSRLAQYPEEENLLRTLKKYLGEETEDGYYFGDPNDLKGLINELKKKSKRISNNDLKLEAQAFIDFVETLQKEIELINLLGNDLKPFESLQKAIPIYPELEPLLNKPEIQAGAIPENTKISVSNQLKENTKAISFKQKVRSESWNIQQTLKALMGEEVEGYSFYNDEEYEDLANNHLGGLINFLEKEILGSAKINSLEEKIKNHDESVQNKKNIIEKEKQWIKSKEEAGSLSDKDIKRIATKKRGISRHEAQLAKAEAEFPEDKVRLANEKAQLIKANQKAFKYLDFLKRLQTAIVNKGKYDVTPDAEFIEEANQLFSLNLDRPELTTASQKNKLKAKNTQIEDAKIKDEIAASYQQHLENLVENTTESAKRYFNNDELIEFDDNQLEQNYQLIREKIANYREAVKESNFQLAIELGEQLLAETAYYKQLYKQSSNKNSNSKVGQLTRIQNEVLRGDSGRGRVDVPLSEIANQPGIRQLSIDFQDIGNDVQRGFDLGADGRESGEQFAEDVIEGANDGFETRSPSKVFEYIGRMVKQGFDIGAKGVEAGENFAKEVINSVKDGLDINSPSDLFEWIGKMARIGFNEGVSGMYDELLVDAAIAEQNLRNTFSGVSDTAQNLREALNSPSSATDIAESISNTAQELNDTPSWIDYIFDTEGADNSIKEFFAGILNSVSDFYDDIKQRFPILQRVEDILGDIAGELLQLFGLSALGETLFNFAAASLDAAMAIESLESSLMSVSSSSSVGASNIAFIRAEARKLNIELAGAMEAYTRIVGATHNTPLEGLQTKQIFTTLATTARNRGLSPDATSRMFLGFEQAIAKGEFKSEEVRGQLAEVLGDIQNLLATAVGVPITQLSGLMEAGDLKVAEVMPKLLAQLNAQNAAMEGSASTAQAAQIRLNNAVLEFQDAVGRRIQPVQKLGLNVLAAALEKLRDKVRLLIRVVATLITTILVNLALSFLATRITAEVLFFTLIKLAGAIQKMLPLLLKFMKRWVLIGVAIEVWYNNIKLAQNAFPTLNKRLEASTKRLEALRKAFDDTGDAAKNYGNNSNQMQLNEGLEIPDNGFGKVARFVAGGDRLNLDNLIRNRIQGFQRMRSLALSGFNSFLFGEEAGNKVRRYYQRKEITTQAQKKQADFVVGASDLMMNVDSTLRYGNEAKKVLEEIAVIDKRARELQQSRNSISSGDEKALKEVKKRERKVLEQRDKLLKKTSQYQQSLQQDIEDVKNTLLELDELDKTGGTKEERTQRANTRNALSTRLEDLEAEKDAIDAINSRIPKFLSAVDRLLRNSSERVSGFIANQDDDAVKRRNEILKDAIVGSLSDTEVELKVDEGSIDDLKKRITLIGKEIDTLEDNLNSDYLTEGVAGLEALAAKDDLELTSDTIERMLESDLTAPEKKAANVLLQLDEFESLKNQSESELLDLIRNQKTQLQDFNRTIEDYFFNLTQRIKEARVETETLLSQIFATNIKNKLRSVLLPGSDSFVNGIIDGIQGILDQAQSLIERSLGIDSGVIQLESEARSKTLEMQDFIRSIGGATDAIDNFGNRINVLAGNVSANGITNANNNRVDGANHNNYSSPRQSNSAIVTNLRRAIIGKESAGKFNAVNPHSGALGYGQVMPANVASWTREATGRAMPPKAFLNNPEAQIKTIDYKLKQYLDRELKATGGDVATAVRRVASTWYSGRPELYNNTRPQTYGTGKYPSINDYTADILTRFNREGGGNIIEVSNINSDTNSNTNNNIANRAGSLTKELTNNLGQNLDLQKILLQLDLDGQFEQAIANEQEKIRRQFQLEAITQENKGLDLQDRLSEKQQSASLTTAESEMLSQLRSTASEFRNIKVEGVQELLRLGDTVGNLKGVVEVFPRLIEAINNSGNENLIAAIPVLQSALSNARKQLPELTSQLESTKKNYEAIYSTEEKVTNFISEQGKLKIEAEGISRRTALQTIKTSIATQRGTNEAKRQNELLSEQERLVFRINEIRQQEGYTDFADSLISAERNQSLINEENINRSAEDRDLQYEQKLLQMDSGIASGRATALSAVGNIIEANRVQREAAVAQENLRSLQELIELERTYGANIEKLEELKKKAAEFNSYKLEEIKNQFASLGTTIENLFSANLKSFFENASNAFYSNGDKEKQLLEQKLAFTEEMLALEEKYRDNPNGLEFARERVKKLNDEKLDKIKEEFDLFNRVVATARNAVINLSKEIARLIVQQAAAKIISSVLGGVLGGIGGGVASSGGGATTSLNFDGGAAAFTASRGITVPNYKEGGTTGDRIVKKPISDRLKKISQPIRSAFNREGSKGVLGVFTPGEEILSIKTGEAPRYQALKNRLGSEPLEKIFAGNFLEGGTIERNLLSQLNTSTPSINVRAINGMPQQKQVINNVTNFSASVVTPDADSFRKSEYQSQQDIAEALLRGI